ncbi:MAG: TonB-dependent receptor [Rubrivivax sp.]|nr:TonB-dependent receptor [Rubrivivax sp.]
MKLTRLVGQLALLGIATHAVAQTAPTSERITITGSSIKRVANEGALPMQVISRAELVRQGIASTEQLIMQLNINGNGLDNLASNADVVDGATRGNNGATSANLRGQGSNATLILLNGRRVASHGLNGGTVDLNQIPFSAIERVEVLKDGASSTYGTDAIGGVINFILRTNASGITVNAGIDIPQEKGGEIYSASVTAGFGDLDRDRYNLLVSLGVHDYKALRGDQRGFVNTYQPTRGLAPDTRGAPIATVFASNSLASAISLNNTDRTGRGTGPFDIGSTTQRVNGINILDLPGGAGCSSVNGMSPYEETLWATPTSKYGCAWDTGRAAVLQQPVRNTNLVSRLNVRLGDHVLIGEAVLGRSESAKRFSPNQVSSGAIGPPGSVPAPGTVALPNGSRVANPFVGNNLFYPSTGASYNRVLDALVAAFPSSNIAANRGLGLPLNFRWRCMPCGDREIETETDTVRLLVGAEGPLFGDWEYRTAIAQAQSEATSVTGSGFHYQVPFANLINTGVLDPFSTQQTAAGLAALEAIAARGVRLYDGKFTLQQADFVTSGPLFKLPGGTVLAAVGVDLRTEKFTFTGDTRSNANAVTTQLDVNNNPIAAAQTLIFNVPFDNDLATAGTLKRDIRAVFGEIAVPVFKQLELTASVRSDNYTGFGTTTNPKVSLKYTPNDRLLVRAAYSTGFRVPTFKQVFDKPTEAAYSGRDFPDPATCPSGIASGTNPACAAVTPTIFFGGRQDLKPEESKLSSAGLVFQLTPEVSGNLDWWSIKREGTIQALGLSTMAANYRFFTDRFIRDGAGVLTGVDTSWINAGSTETSGLEFGLQAVTNLAGARWNGSYDLSYLLKKRSKLTPRADFGASEVGVFTRAGDLGVRWKHTLSITRTAGDWSTTLSQIYRTGYADFVLPGVANGTYNAPAWNPRVKPYETFNASVGWTGIENLAVTAGIKNLFNEDPPFSVTYDTNTGAGSSWEPRVADPRGRAYTLRMEYKFF